VEKILETLLIHLENNIIERGEAINNEHFKVTNVLSKKLLTLAEVDEMDKYK